MYTWCKQFKSWKMCEITGTSYLRLDLWLRRHSWFRRCTQCHPERRHLMILWFLQTRSDDDEKQNDSWHRRPAHVQNTMQGNSSCQKHYISLYSESLTWYSLTDVMLTSKRLHRSSSSLTTTSWFSRPSTSIHTFSSAVSAADMGEKKWIVTTKYQTGSASHTFRRWTRGYNKLRTYPMNEARMMQNTAPYMSTACRPRISGRCPWSGAGEGSASKPFAWLPSGCCLEGTGSDLAEKTGKSILHFVTYQRRDTLLSMIFVLENDKKCGSPCDCQCTDIFDGKWNTWLAWEHVAFSTISTAEGAQALIVSIGLTPLCAQSVVVRRGGEVPLRLLIGQLPVQLVLFETFLSVLSVSPATQPSLQCALWTWGVRDKHKEDKTVCCCLDV